MASDHTTTTVPDPTPHDPHGDENLDPTPYRPSSAKMILTVIVGLCLLGVLVVVGVLPRLKASAVAKDDRERLAGEAAKVLVDKPVRPKPGSKVILPGTVQAVQDAVIYARTSGYVRTYKVDIGDSVKTGQVLATLDTPDIDQELREAEAALQQARANIDQAKTQLALAGTEATRYRTLAGSGVVSQQDMEEHTANFDARGANVKAITAAEGSAQANLQRLRELKGFATVVAPFDGVITSRSVEVGQLVQAGTGAGQAMFRISNMSVVRVYVNVPQVYAAGVHVGDEAEVMLREIPNHPFVGKVTRTTRAIDPATRTLLTEIRIPNPDGQLFQGMYAELQLPVTRADSPLLIRPTALVADANGTRVAVVDHGAIKWKDVKIDSDLGDQIAILSGLDDNDDVVVAPSDRLTDGMLVHAERAPIKTAQASPGAGGPAPAAGSSEGLPPPVGSAGSPATLAPAVPMPPPAPAPAAPPAPRSTP